MFSSADDLPTEVADSILAGGALPAATSHAVATQTEPTATCNRSSSVCPSTDDSAAQVAVVTREAGVDAGHGVRRLVFGLPPGISLHEILLATRQLGADVDAVVDGLLRTVAVPLNIDRRRQLRDVVTVVAAARRDHAAEVVGAVYRIQHLRQAVPYATAEEAQLRTWLRDGQENAAAWALDEDLLRQSEPPLWCPGPPPPTGAPNDPGLD